MIWVFLLYNYITILSCILVCTICGLSSVSISISISIFIFIYLCLCVDSGLSHRGVQFAEALGVYISKNEDLPADKLCVWTSTMRRCKETTTNVKCKRLESIA